MAVEPLGNLLEGVIHAADIQSKTGTGPGSLLKRLGKGAKARAERF